MDYGMAVEDPQKQFGELAKVASDLAAILDHPAMQLDEKNKAGSIIKARVSVIDLLCAVHAKAGMELPMMEKDLLEAIIGPDGSANDPKAREIMHQVESRLLTTGNMKSSDAFALASVLQIIPRVIDEFASIGFSQIMAAINRDLIRRGCEPIRPDYSQWKLEFPIDRPKPNRVLNVLVVDDRIEDACDTLTRLAGWPGLRFDLYHYRPEVRPFGASHEQKQAEIDRVHYDILSSQPDIVLMDEGMDPISGHEVVERLRAVFTGVIVANTGGLDGDLRRAGALSNCDKGRIWQAIEDAICVIECRPE